MRIAAHNRPRNAGKTISRASTHDPEPEEIPNADQGRYQSVHLTKTIRSVDSCLFRQLAALLLHAQRLCVTSSAARLVA